MPHPLNPSTHPPLHHCSHRPLKKGKQKITIKWRHKNVNETRFLALLLLLLLLLLHLLLLLLLQFLLLIIKLLCFSSLRILDGITYMLYSILKWKQVQQTNLPVNMLINVYKNIHNRFYNNNSLCSIWYFNFAFAFIKNSIFMHIFGQLV